MAQSYMPGHRFLASMIGFTVAIVPSLATEPPDRLLKLPEVRLAAIPESIQLRTGPPAATVEEINELIDALSDRDVSEELEKTISDPDGHWTRSTDHMPETERKGLDKHDVVRRLLHLGPVAIPVLLSRLDDSVPTSTVIEATSGGGANSSLFFSDRMHGNPLHPHESQILGLAGRCYTRNDWSDLQDYSQIDRYTFKTGDVCFVILGQIVGRDYRCLHGFNKYDSAIYSPVYDSELRRQLRSIWSQDNIRQYLFESLMLDLCTRGVPGGKHDEGLHNGGHLQVAAVERLLYYYQEESQSAVKSRLSQLDIDDSKDAQIANGGVRAIDMIRAIQPFRSAEMESVLHDLQSKSKDSTTTKYIEDTLKLWQTRRSKSPQEGSPSHP